MTQESPFSIVCNYVISLDVSRVEGLCLLNNTHTPVLNVGLGLDWIGMTEACLHLSVLHLLHLTGVYSRVLCKIRSQCLDLATHNLSLLVTFNCTWVMGGGGFIR